MTDDEQPTAAFDRGCAVSPDENPEPCSRASGLDEARS